MRYLLTFVMLAVLAVPAYAAFEGPNSGGQSMGGFQGPTGGVQADTVKKAQSSWDDAPVVLVGNAWPAATTNICSRTPRARSSWISTTRFSRAAP